MNKLTPIEYIENSLSYQPKIILSWVTEGIVINNTRYSVKEFRLKEDGKLYAVIAENKYDPEYFEVQLCNYDEEILKDIYKAIKDNKIAIYKEITDRENEINRVDNAIKENTAKIDEGITDHQNDINRVDKAIAANTTKINQEITDRTNEITRVDGAISTLNSSLSQKQNKLTSGEGITIQDNVISASGGGSSSVIKVLEDNPFITAIEHVETSGNIKVTTFSFEISAYGGVTINNPLKGELLPFFTKKSKYINGGLELYVERSDSTTDMFIGNIKNGSEDDRQHATFTFYERLTSGDGKAS